MRFTRPPRGLIATCAASVLLAACGGSGDGAPPPVSVAPQPALHHVIDGLPDGFVAFDAADVPAFGLGSGWTFGEHFHLSLYGTPDRPDAPAMLLAASDTLRDDGFAQLQGAVEPFRLTGRMDGMCGTDPSAMQVCYLGAGSVQMAGHARGIDEARLSDLLGVAELHDGVPSVPASTLPAGMQLLGNWSDSIPGAASGTAPGAAMSVVKYSDADGRRLWLTVGRADDQELAAAFDQAHLEAVDTDGIRVFAGAAPALLMRLAVWEAGGYAYVLTSMGHDALDPVSLVAGVRAASPDEWQQAVEGQAPSTRPQPPESSSPPDLHPNAVTPAHTTEVPATFSVVASPSGWRASSTLPDGTAATVDWVSWGDARMYGLDGGPCTVEVGGDTERYPIVVLQNDTVKGVLVVTSRTDAARLEVVRGNGDRHLVDLVTVEGGDERVAFVAVPIDDLAEARLVDAFGRQIDRFG